MNVRELMNKLEDMGADREVWLEVSEGPRTFVHPAKSAKIDRARGVVLIVAGPLEAGEEAPPEP
jgi:hypothetical protein